MDKEKKMGYIATYSLSVFSPFALVPPPEEEKGIFLGEDTYHRPVYLNYRRLPNFHGIILGPTGSGKSTTVENLLYDLVENGMNFITIDPGLDYVAAVNDLGGVDIDMTRNTPDIFDAPCDIDYWLSMMANALSYSLNLDPYSTGIIKNALSEAKSGGIEDVVDYLESYPELSGMVGGIVKYIKEPNFSMDEVIKNNRPACLTYRSRERRLPPEVEKFLTIYFIMWVREYYMSQPPIHSPKLIFIIDEAWRLLKGTEQLNLVEYLREMRKYGVGYWIVTQSVTDMPLEAYEQFGFTLALSGPKMHTMKLDALMRLRKDDIDWLLSHKMHGFGVLIRSGYPKATQLRVVVREDILKRRRK